MKWHQITLNDSYRKLDKNMKNKNLINNNDV